MTKIAEINRLKFELQLVQNEIYRRNLQPDSNADQPYKAMAALQSRRHKIQHQLAVLRSGVAP